MLSVIGAWFASRVGGFVAENALKLLWVGAALLAVLATLFMVRKGGKDAARLEELEKAIEVVRTRRDVERQMKDAPDAELDKWLRAPARRR